MIEGQEYHVVWGYERTHRSAYGFYEGRLRHQGNTYLKFSVTGGALLLVDEDFFIAAEPYQRRIVI